MKFQIRDEDFGIAIYEAESAGEALLDYFADRARGQYRPKVQRLEDGSAQLYEADGRLYRAVPVPDE